MYIQPAYHRPHLPFIISTLAQTSIQKKNLIYIQNYVNLRNCRNKTLFPILWLYSISFWPVFHSFWFWTPDFHWGSSTSAPLLLLLCLMAGWRSLSVYKTVPSRVWGTVTATFSSGETSLALPVVSLAFLSIWNLWQWHTTHFSSGVSFISSRWMFHNEHDATNYPPLSSSQPWLLTGFPISLLPLLPLCFRACSPCSPSFQCFLSVAVILLKARYVFLPFKSFIWMCLLKNIVHSMDN